MNKDLKLKQLKLKKIKDFDKKIREFNFNKEDDEDDEEEEEENNSIEELINIKCDNEYMKKLKKTLKKKKIIKERIEENLKNKDKLMKDGNKLIKKKLKNIPINKKSLDINIKNVIKNESLTSKKEKKTHSKINYFPKKKLKKIDLELKKILNKNPNDIYSKLTNIENETNIKEKLLKFVPEDKLENFEKIVDEEYLNLINLKLNILKNNN